MEMVQRFNPALSMNDVVLPHAVDLVATNVKPVGAEGYLFYGEEYVCF